MPTLNLAPTKSNLLALRRQLTFALEGYDLLEQKRQILILELMRRLERIGAMERQVAAAARAAFGALREAELDAGAAALERAALAVARRQRVEIAIQHLMGLRLPRVTCDLEAPGPAFGATGSSARADEARRRLLELLPLLAERAELETAARRLARELRKTQRRCNTLSKLLIPSYRGAISFIAAALEERERESLVILRMVRNRLRLQTQ